MVCMPLEDLHIIAAKRAVADELSRERAWVLLQHQKAVEGLKLQCKLCDEQVADLTAVIRAERGERQVVIDANRDLQARAGGMRAWATVGKVSVVLVGVAVVGGVVGQLVP